MHSTKDVLPNIDQFLYRCWAMRLSGINPWDLYTAILFLGWTGSIIVLITFFMMRGTRTMAKLIHTIMHLTCQSQPIKRPFLSCVCEKFSWESSFSQPLIMIFSIINWKSKPMCTRCFFQLGIPVSWYLRKGTSSNA